MKLWIHGALVSAALTTVALTWYISNHKGASARRVDADRSAADDIGFVEREAFDTLNFAHVSNRKNRQQSLQNGRNDALSNSTKPFELESVRARPLHTSARHDTTTISSVQARVNVRQVISEVQHRGEVTPIDVDKIVKLQRYMNEKDVADTVRELQAVMRASDLDKSALAIPD